MAVMYQPPPDWRELTKERFEAFITGMMSTATLMNRAGREGAFLEYICLATTHIDSALRLALILESQLSNRIELNVDKLIFQEDRRGIRERQVYKWCEERKVISKSLHDELEELYEFRNAAVHRYVTTRVRYEKFYEVAKHYEGMLSKVGTIVGELEQEQLARGVGMCVLVKEERGDPKLTELWKNELDDKHGAINPEVISADELRQERKLIAAVEQVFAELKAAVWIELRKLAQERGVAEQLDKVDSMLMFLARLGHSYMLLVKFEKDNMPVLQTIAEYLRFDPYHSTSADWTRVAAILKPLSEIVENAELTQPQEQL